VVYFPDPHFYRKKMMAQSMDIEKTTPNTHNELLDPNTKTVIRMCKIKRGDDELVQPKVVADIADRDLQVYMRLCAFQVLYSDTSANGDQEKFNKSPEQAVNGMTLIPGVPFENVKRGMPNLEQDQHETLEVLEKMHKDLLIAAFTNEDVKCSGKVKAKQKALKILKKASIEEITAKLRKKKDAGSESDIQKKAKEAYKKVKHSPEEIEATALHVYLEDAHDAGMKEVTFTDNGEEKTEMALKIKRKVRGMRTVEENIDGEVVKKRKLVPTPPVFHKSTPTGEYYEKKYGDFIPRGTLMQFRVRRSFYTSPMSYGTNMTFDKDVTILCETKKRARKAVSKPAIYFEDADEEPDTKRARSSSE